MKISIYRNSLITVFLATLFAANAWALPPQAEADKLMIEAKAAMQAGDYATAARDFARVEELHVKIPATFAYHYGTALLESGNYKRALEQFDRYITQSGATGKFYKEALEQYAKAEANIKNPIMKVMVRIPGRNYEMGKTEVTQGQWEAVMGSNPSNFSNCGDTCPVENVSWDDAQAFIQKLNAKTGKQYRLPTEAEWEYACHGGSQHEYCGGDSIDAVAWYDGNSGDKTHAVGQKQANGYGLYDMSGNVWEWMSDCYDGDCAKRVRRGGAWSGDPQFARAADRSRGEPAVRGNVNLGFRLARMLP